MIPALRMGRAPSRAAANARRLMAALALLVLASPARAAESAPGAQGDPSRNWVSAAALLGSTQPDAKLADYQWQTSPSAGWGAQVMAGHGSGSLGVRFWSSDASQSINVPGASVQSATVNEMSLEAVLAARVWSVAGLDVEPALSGGRLRLAYQPEQVVVPTGGLGSTTVQLGPIDEWQWGGGVSLARPFAGRWSAGLGLDVRFYSLDTAHRNGSVIETGRQGFEDWSLRFLIARRFRIG